MAGSDDPTTEAIVKAMIPNVRKAMRAAITSTFDAAYMQGLLEGARIAEALGRNDVAKAIRARIDAEDE